MDELENERLTHTGPGTPCGELMRRYWFPVAIASELTDLPKLIRFLGEDLVLFRDGQGRPGLLGKHCSHRGTSLEFGQIDEEGIRCCYHAWLYDVEGRVLDTPAEPPESNFKQTIHHIAYPCRELGGWIFTYMGPQEKMPELPGWDFLVREDATRELWTVVENYNWLNNTENFGDPVHTALLHQIPSRFRFGNHRIDIPQFEVDRTEDGICITQIRESWRRRTRFILPHLAILPEVRETTFNDVGTALDGAHALHEQVEPFTLAFWTVPIDDTCTLSFRMLSVPLYEGKPRGRPRPGHSRGTPREQLQTNDSASRLPVS